MRNFKSILTLGVLALIGLTLSPQVQAGNAHTGQAVQQSKEITGNVSDSEGPLIGATVMVKGSNTGVVTDINGNFHLMANAGATLVISYVGYVTQETPAREHLNIILEQEGRNLNEVVVIGYGTQRREAVTGSVVNINGEKLNAKLEEIFK